MEAGVNHFALDVQVPMSMPRRLFAWVAAQIDHVSAFEGKAYLNMTGGDFRF